MARKNNMFTRGFAVLVTFLAPFLVMCQGNVTGLSKIKMSKVDSLIAFHQDTVNIDSLIYMKVDLLLKGHRISYNSKFRRYKQASIYGDINSEDFVSSSLNIDGLENNIVLTYPLCDKKQPVNYPLLFGFNEIDNPQGNLYHCVRLKNDTFYVFSIGSLACNGSGCSAHYFLIVNFKKHTFYLLPFLYDFPLGFRNAFFGDYNNDTFLDGYIYCQTKDYDNPKQTVKGYFVPFSIAKDRVLINKKGNFYAYVYSRGQFKISATSNWEKIFNQIIYLCN